jgi:hypothetical protein
VRSSGFRGVAARKKTSSLEGNEAM